MIAAESNWKFSISLEIGRRVCLRLPPPVWQRELSRIAYSFGFEEKLILGRAMKQQNYKVWQEISWKLSLAYLDL